MIHWLNHYLVDGVVCLPTVFPVNSVIHPFNEWDTDQWRLFACAFRLSRRLHTRAVHLDGALKIHHVAKRPMKNAANLVVSFSFWLISVSCVNSEMESGSSCNSTYFAINTFFVSTSKWTSKYSKFPWTLEMRRVLHFSKCPFLLQLFPLLPCCSPAVSQAS